jgi:hypothetical protein
LKNFGLSKYRKHKVIYVSIWIVLITLWPISLSYYFYKKSKSIHHMGLRVVALTAIAIFAIFSNIAWAATLFGSNQPQKSQNSQTKTVTAETHVTQVSNTHTITQQIEPPAQAIGRRTKNYGCVAIKGIQDKACTPGAVFANVTTAQICKSGYASSVRDVSESTKDEVYAEYGITTHTTGQYEVDHLVSLELGGSNDIANLWPEAASPTPGFHQKDEVENTLHDEVCNGTISLAKAQGEIASDWLAIYNGTTPTVATPQKSISSTAPKAASDTSGVVKLSTSGICHVPGDPYYERTTNYTPYNTLQECLNAGGRLPKN